MLKNGSRLVSACIFVATIAAYFAPETYKITAAQYAALVTATVYIAINLVKNA